MSRRSEVGSRSRRPGAVDIPRPEAGSVRLPLEEDDRPNYAADGCYGTQSGSDVPMTSVKR